MRLCSSLEEDLYGHGPPPSDGLRGSPKVLNQRVFVFISFHSSWMSVCCGVWCICDVCVWCVTCVMCAVCVVCVFVLLPSTAEGRGFKGIACMFWEAEPRLVTEPRKSFLFPKYFMCPGTEADHSNCLVITEGKVFLQSHTDNIHIQSRIT